MVKGLEVFKHFFCKYKDQYVLIGGSACDILLEDADMTFRATRDLDVVLIVESLTPEFGRAFWDFIKAGRYRNRSRSSGVSQFYRFDKPETAGFPYMLELFSKQPVNMSLRGKEHTLMPLHIDDEISSLSAILLNESYYQMLLAGQRQLDGLMLLGPEYIIAFKAKAWLELSDKKKNGFHVDEKDIKKHKSDIARLTAILEGRVIQHLPEEVRIDMERFIALYEREPADLKALRIKNITNEEITGRLREVFISVD